MCLCMTLCMYIYTSIYVYKCMCGCIIYVWGMYIICVYNTRSVQYAGVYRRVCVCVYIHVLYACISMDAYVIIC